MSKACIFTLLSGKRWICISLMTSLWRSLTYDCRSAFTQPLQAIQTCVITVSCFCYYPLWGHCNRSKGSRKLPGLHQWRVPPGPIGCWFKFAYPRLQCIGISAISTYPHIRIRDAKFRYHITGMLPVNWSSQHNSKAYVTPVICQCLMFIPTSLVSAWCW